MNSDFLTRAFLIGLVFNIAANLLAIPPLTYRGAALVTVLSELALLAPFYYALRKHMAPLPIFDIFWRPVVAGIAMGMVLFLLVAVKIYYWRWSRGHSLYGVMFDCHRRVGRG